MLNCGKKFRALRDKKNKYSNSCVVRKKNSERYKKTIPPPPFKLNGRSLTGYILYLLVYYLHLYYSWGRHLRDRMVVGFSTTCVISAHH